MAQIVSGLRALAWRYWAGAAALAAAAMLLIAHGFQHIGGFAPCSLCYRQREAYWAVLIIAAVTALLWYRRPREAITRAIEALIGVAFLTGAAVATYHAGVEWGLWAGPTTCVGGGFNPDVLLGTENLDDLGKELGKGACGLAPFRVFGLSMAGMNALVALALAGVSFVSAARVTDKQLDELHV